MDSIRPPQLLFGMSFGLYNSNSIGVSWRNNKEGKHKIDLFSHIYNTGTIPASHYAGTIQTEKRYLITIKNKFKDNCYYLEGWDLSDNDKTMLRVFNFSTHFKYPSIKFGYTIQRINGHKILLERK